MGLDVYLHRHIRNKSNSQPFKLFIFLSKNTSRPSFIYVHILSNFQAFACSNLENVLDAPHVKINAVTLPPKKTRSAGIVIKTI